MRLAIIAAVARNRVIGVAGAMPWHIPDDLRRFKRLTIGHTVLMGRKTYASIGKPLPGRRNVVVGSVTYDGVECCPTIKAALAATAGDELVFVIGGGMLYEQLLPQADILHLTLVDQSPVGDTMFPPYEHLIGPVFRLAHREDHQGFHFLDYERTHELSA
jgi:dihydrofolate reductase